MEKGCQRVGLPDQCQSENLWHIEIFKIIAGRDLKIGIYVQNKNISEIKKNSFKIC